MQYEKVRIFIRIEFDKIAFEASQFYFEVSIKIADDFWNQD